MAASSLQNPWLGNLVWLREKPSNTLGPTRQDLRPHPLGILQKTEYDIHRKLLAPISRDMHEALKSAFGWKFDQLESEQNLTRLRNALETNWIPELKVMERQRGKLHRRWERGIWHHVYSAQGGPEMIFDAVEVKWRLY